ncbi:hypothetical protein B0H12DRAFT_681774 [Mycena haematopus]|nr:hypothetical protein B0H12DRAFT_681774 [Mycena haematopus]
MGVESLGGPRWVSVLNSKGLDEFSIDGSFDSSPSLDPCPYLASSPFSSKFLSSCQVFTGASMGVERLGARGGRLHSIEVSQCGFQRIARSTRAHAFKWCDYDCRKAWLPTVGIFTRSGTSVLQQIARSTRAQALSTMVDLTSFFLEFLSS